MHPSLKCRSTSLSSSINAKKAPFRVPFRVGCGGRIYEPWSTVFFVRTVSIYYRRPYRLLTQTRGSALVCLSVNNKKRDAMHLFLCYWLRRQDLNLQPSGYEPDELPGCSTPRYEIGAGDRGRTGTGLLPRDFKSRASAYSATPAFRSQTMRFS